MNGIGQGIGTYLYPILIGGGVGAIYGGVKGSLILTVNRIFADRVEKSLQEQSPREISFFKVVVIGPVAEEMVFREVLPLLLAGNFCKGGIPRFWLLAYIVSSIAFGILHFFDRCDFISACNAGLAIGGGLVYSALHYRFGFLACLSAHMMYNFSILMQARYLAEREADDLPGSITC